MTVAINNLTTNEVDENYVKKIVTNVLKGEGARPKSEVSIAFVGSGRIRKINRKYRHINRATDVLAFPEEEVSFQKFSIGPLRKTGNLGEVVVCLREVKKAVKRFNVSFEQELARVLIHGILHLLGYEHEKSEKEAQRMKEREEQYLRKIKNQKSKCKMKV